MTIVVVVVVVVVVVGRLSAKKWQALALGTLLHSIAKAKIAGCHPWAETGGASGPCCESHVIKQPLGRQHHLGNDRSRWKEFTRIMRRLRLIALWSRKNAWEKAGTCVLKSLEFLPPNALPETNQVPLKLGRAKRRGNVIFQPSNLQFSGVNLLLFLAARTSNTWLFRSKALLWFPGFMNWKFIQLTLTSFALNDIDPQIRSSNERRTIPEI